MQIKAMRDIFLEELYQKMSEDSSIFFVAADFGSPVLDKIRADYPDRFINVGIAEQNLINISTGLALEGYSVYAYAIAPFITMRCFEQIRVNIAILSQIRPMNINLIGVGAGVSYAMSGPTHHCLEDLSIMSTLPNMEVFSPSDYITAQKYVARSLEQKSPKYIRFDAKPMAALSDQQEDIKDGFRVLHSGKRVAIISTGYMTQKCADIVKSHGAKLIDIYLINRYDRELLRAELEDIETIITVEEGFSNAGGLDSEINYHFKDKRVLNMGFDKQYTFEIGDREFVHAKNGLAVENITNVLNEVLEL
jgi:transketolase